MKKIVLVSTTALMALALAGCACSTSTVADEGAAATGRAAQEDAAPESHAEEAESAVGEAYAPDGAEDAPANPGSSTATAAKPRQNAQSSASNSSSSSSANSNLEVNEHVHDWVYHEAVTEQVWVEDRVYVPRYTCGHCGVHTYSSSAADAHQKAEGLETGTFYAYYSNGYYEDKGRYETQTVTPAYYSCACGATK